MQPISQILKTPLAQISQFLGRRTPAPTDKGKSDPTKTQMQSPEIVFQHQDTIDLKPPGSTQPDFLLGRIGVGPQDKFTRTPKGYYVQVNRTQAAPPLPPGTNPYESFKEWLKIRESTQSQLVNRLHSTGIPNAWIMEFPHAGGMGFLPVDSNRNPIRILGQDPGKPSPFGSHEEALEALRSGRDKRSYGMISKGPGGAAYGRM